MWYKEAHKEIGLEDTNSLTINHDYAIFPKSLYLRIEKLMTANKNKKPYNFCFLGGLKTDDKTYTNRYWILDFIKKHFDSSSYLLFTDRDTKKRYRAAGTFDKTLEVDGFVPKYVPIPKRNQFDHNYYDVLSKCKFCLAPAGDNPFSMRFYEALAARCIPIVNDHVETYRSKQESTLPYKYYLASDVEKDESEESAEHHANTGEGEEEEEGGGGGGKERGRGRFEYRHDWVESNTATFMKWHTLAFRQNS